MGERERRMIGHAAVVAVFGLLAGFGLLMRLIGGFELAPGTILEFELPGDSAAWARAHSGGLMNGLLVMAGAFAIWGLQPAEALAARLSWMFIGTGYANTIFYWGGLLAANRALTFGDNRHGETSLAGVIGLAPAFVFAFITTIAMILIAREAFRARVAD